MNLDFDKQFIDELEEELKPYKCRIHKDKLVRVNEDLEVFSSSVFGGRKGESLSMVAKRFGALFTDNKTIYLKTKSGISYSTYSIYNTDSYISCESIIITDKYAIIDIEEQIYKTYININEIKYFNNLKKED